MLCSIIPTFNPVLPPINLAEVQEFTNLKIAAIIRPFGDDSPDQKTYRNHHSSDVTGCAVIAVHPNKCASASTIIYRQAIIHTISFSNCVLVYEFSI